MTWTRLATAAAVVSLVVTSACGVASGSGGDATDRTLQIRISEDPGSLDPHTTNSSQALLVAAYMYDTLVGLDADGNVVPRLASEWEANASSATFTLRDDITCSDGTPLKPSHVAANFERVQDPETESSLTSSYLGSTEYDVVADDEAGTVTLKLPQPYGALLPNLGKFPRIICPSGLEDPERLSSEAHGTGAFVLDQSVPGDHFSLTKREGYEWGPDGMSTGDKGFPQGVELRVVGNDTTAANQLVTGDLDLAFVDGPERARLDDRENLSAKDAPVGITTLALNQAKGRPGADPEVRRALVQAIDREAMTKTGLGDFGEVADSLLQPDATCYDSAAGDSIPEHDVAAARAVLADVDTELQLYAIEVDGNEYVAEAWREVGVESRLNSGDESGPGLDIVFGGGDWDAALITFNGITQLSMLTPFLSGPTPPKGTNYMYSTNTAFPRLAARASETAGDEGCAYATQAMQALFDGSDIIPLSFQSRGFFSTPDLDYYMLGSGIEPTSLRISTD